MSNELGEDEQRAEEGEILPDLRDSVVLALLAANLVGRRVVVNGQGSERERDDVVFAVESVGEDGATLVYGDGRKIGLDGRIEHLRVEWEPEPSGPFIL